MTLNELLQVVDKGLSVQEATELLSLTVDQIRKSALNEKL